MKNLATVIILIILATSCFAQTSANDRDSVANSLEFKTKVKLRVLSAANDLLADTTQHSYTINYAQLIVSDPSGVGWLTALSYGVMNNPAINYDSSDGDIQFTVNSIFVKYAKAYYRIVN
ncbi:MAG: hypothetical protein ABI091_26830 [Ferruginibacter sp.]